MAKFDYGRRFGFDAKRRPADIRLVLLPGCVPCSGNEVLALLDKTGTGQCLVAFHRPPGFYPLSVFESDSPGLDTAAGLGFPERLPDLFRPSKYLGGSPSPREHPGSTRAGRLLGHGDVFQGDGDSLDPGLAGSGDYGRLGLADKLQFSALL